MILTHCLNSLGDLRKTVDVLSVCLTNRNDKDDEMFLDASQFVCMLEYYDVMILQNVNKCYFIPACKDIKN